MGKELRDYEKMRQKIIRFRNIENFRMMGETDNIPDGFVVLGYNPNLEDAYRCGVILIRKPLFDIICGALEKAGYQVG